MKEHVMEEKKQSFVLFGYRLFHELLLCAGLYLCFRDRLPLREEIWLNLFMLAVLSAGIAFLDSLKGRKYLCAALVFLAVCAVFVTGRPDAAETTGAGAFFREIFYLSAIVAGVYLCHLLTERFVWLKRIAAFLFLAGLVAAMICRREVARPVVAAVLLYAVVALIEWVESGWRKQKQGSERAYLLWLLPFLAGYFVLAAVMPYGEKPYDWAFFVNLYERVHERLLTFSENAFHSGDEDLGLSTTGFSEEGGFFGNLERSEKTVLKIDNPGQREGVLYLGGRNFDSFDGRQWEQSAFGGERDCYLDTLMTLCAVYGYDKEYSGDYLRMHSIGVEYRHFHTGFLLAPLKTYRVESDKAELRQQGGNFVFEKKRGYGTSYQLSYQQLNLGNPVFDALLLSAGGLPEQDVFDSAVRNLPGEAQNVTLEELAAYGERVKKDYTGAAEMSPAAETFLAEAVSGAETDYEKLLCLERALGSLSYNPRPGKLPREVDTAQKFLDYFLVESREGYCSYFASAFVLLARAEGIPARYVQGYRVSLRGLPDITVTDNMAHAWPEAWIDGIGWIPFEPTPGYYGTGRTSWAAHRNAQPIRVELSQDWLDGEREKAEGEDALSEEDLEAQRRAEERQRRLELLAFLGYFLTLLAVLAVLFLAADALWERRCAARRSAEESFRLEALRCLQILAALGYRRRPAETLSELQSRLERRDANEFADFVSLCEEVLYGGRTPDREAVAGLRRTQEKLLERLRERKGRAYPLSRFGLYLTRAR